jgi:hypothetical protein
VQDRTDRLWERFDAKTDQLISIAIEVTLDDTVRELDLDADAMSAGPNPVTGLRRRTTTPRPPRSRSAALRT